MVRLMSPIRVGVDLQRDRHLAIFLLRRVVDRIERQRRRARLRAELHRPGRVYAGRSEAFKVFPVSYIR